MTMPKRRDDPGDWMGEGVDLARRLSAYVEQLRVSKWRIPGQATAADCIADDLQSILRKEWDPVDEPR